MRRLLAPVLTAGLVALTLVGCSTSAPAETACPRPTSTGGSLFETIEVTGDAPRLEAYTPIRATETVWDDVTTGEGTPITSDNQLVVMDLTFFKGSDGEQRNPNGGTGSVTVGAPLSQLAGVLPGLPAALECARPGARVVTVLAADSIEPSLASALALDEGEPAVVVADVQQVFLAKAHGDDQFVDGRGLPAVVRADDGRPGIIVPGSEAPEELVVEVLKKGRGDVVEAGETVVVHYTGVTWADGEVFDSSWDSAPVRLSLDQVVPGFAQALEGTPVGSQVLAIIPPELGYGDQGSGTIPGGATLVFVIDILGIVE